MSWNNNASVKWLCHHTSIRPNPLIAAPVRVMALALALAFIVVVAIIYAAVEAIDKSLEVWRDVVVDGVLMGHLPAEAPGERLRRELSVDRKCACTAIPGGYTVYNERGE